MKEKIHSLLRLQDSPHKLALAFALGVFVAFSPTIGLHIITCLVLAWFFRLSKLVILTASFINNPWTIVPLYGFCIWFGTKITGQQIAVPAIAWNELRLVDVYPILQPFLISYVVGTLIIGAAVAVLSYFLFYRAVVRYQENSANEK